MVLESLGQWDRVELLAGGFAERFAIRGTAGARQGKRCAFVKPL